MARSPSSAGGLIMKKEIFKTDILKAVTVSKVEPFVSSVFIAKVFEKNHDKVLRDIDNMKISLANFGESVSKYFKDSSYINARGKEYRRYDLTRNGFDLIVLSFTGDKALRYKVWFIDGFHEKEAFIQEQKMIISKHEGSDMWLAIRSETKLGRTALTDAIKTYELPQRIQEGKASDRFLEMRIINYTQLIYKVLDIHLPIGVNPRDVLDPRTLFKLEDLEYSVANKIKELICDRKCHYKQAYALIKKELLEPINRYAKPI